MPRSSSPLALGVALALAAGAVAPAAAGAQRPQLSLGGGATVPTGDLGDAVRTGWHGHVALGYRPPMFPLGFRVDGGYHDLAGETDEDGDERPGFRAVGVTGNVVLEAPALAVRPYVIAGAGLYNTRVEGRASRNALGVNAGAGIRFQLLDVESYLEARYHAVLDAIGPERNPTAARFVPLTFGISF